MENNESTLQIGFGQAEITPKTPVAMIGLYSLRRTERIQTPLLAIAAAVSLDGREPVYWVACDLLYITRELVDAVYLRLSAEISDFRREQLLLSATHIHTGPFLKNEMETTLLSFPREFADVLTPRQYCEQAAQAITEAVLKALADREPAVTARASADVLTGYCRRGVFADGTAKMYPDVHSPQFSHMEGRNGGPIKGVFVLRSKDNTLKGAIVDVPCPAQANVHTPYVHADYWHYVRNYVNERLEIPILGLCGCAGDLSPRNLFDPEDTDAAARMKSLGLRVGEAVERMAAELSPDAPALEHGFLELQLERWEPTPGQYQSARSVCKQLFRHYNFTPGQSPFHNKGFPKYLYSEAEAVIKRFEGDKEQVAVPIHALRLGKAVFLTNPFECFTAYKDRIASLLPDLDIYDIQLTDQYHGYLPTQSATYGGGYSACIYNGSCPPVAGDVLVEQSVYLAKRLF